MGWEAPIMEKTAKILCPKEGLSVLNIGFGLGLMDEALQKYKPAHHTIVEAHPDGNFFFNNFINVKKIYIIILFNNKILIIYI